MEIKFPRVAASVVMVATFATLGVAQVPTARPTPEQKALLDRLSKIVDARAAELSLSAEVLAPRGELKALAMGKRETHALTGWRKQEIGDRLRVVHGQLGLRNVVDPRAHDLTDELTACLASDRLGDHSNGVLRLDEAKGHRDSRGGGETADTVDCRRPCGRLFRSKPERVMRAAARLLVCDVRRESARRAYAEAPVREGRLERSDRRRGCFRERLRATLEQ